MSKTSTIERTAIAAILFSALPNIGQPLDEGTFQGVISTKDGKHYAIVLLDSKPTTRLSWKKAGEWADSIGGQLPSRPVAAVLYANAKGLFQRDWYWTCDSLSDDTGDKDDASYAWYCTFSNGTQGNSHESAEGAAVAVRLIPLNA